MSSTLFFVGLKEDSKSSIARSEVEVRCVDELSQDPSAPAPPPEQCVEEISKEPSTPAPVRCTELISQDPFAAAPVRCVEELSKESCASPPATTAADSNTQASPAPKEPTRVPNAPKSCIAEIFSSDTPDRSPVKNGNGVAPRPRVVRDTPTRPRDTHTRLFGQAVSSPVAPMVTDTIRSHIQFGDADSSAASPKLSNGHSATPSRGEPEPASHSSYIPPKRNPVTGDGVPVPAQRRRHPAAWQRGADPDHDHDPRSPRPDLPQPTHRYITLDWPPKPAQCYVHSTTKPTLNIPKTPYTLLGLKSDDPEKAHPLIDPNSLSPQLVLDRHWPPFPAQHYLEPKESKIVTHPLPPYAFVGMTSALGERPQPDYKYNPEPSLDGSIDPYLIATCDPPSTLFKYERDAPIPDVTPLQTSVAPGPHTLTGFPPIFPKHVPGYLFNIDRHAEDLEPKTYYVDYLRRREMEGNPITGDYKSMNGQINTVTSISTSSPSGHSRVPPGGYSAGLW